MAVIIQCTDCGKTVIAQRRSRKRCDDCIAKKDLARWDAHKEAVRARTRKTEEARKASAERLAKKYPNAKATKRLRRQESA